MNTVDEIVVKVQTYPPPNVVYLGQVQPIRPRGYFQGGMHVGLNSRGGTTTAVVYLASKWGETSSQTSRGATFKGGKFKQTGGGQRPGRNPANEEV